jgi:hypothetical protein
MQGLPELLVILVVAVLLLGGKDTFWNLVEAIRNLKGGGPGSPSHPIPGDDSRLLTQARPTGQPNIKGDLLH